MYRKVKSLVNLEKEGIKINDEGEILLKSMYIFI